MVCGNAQGELMPLFINYKSKSLLPAWTDNGPPGTRYSCTESGWFDGDSFEDWFFTTSLPVLKRLDGVKALIGDNLSSHISIKVLESCKENNIKFIALIPNATHLLQPLDVAFFRPMKIAWKNILSDWKETREGTKAQTLPKGTFPELVNKLMEQLEEKKEALKSGFRKTGIYPQNREQPILRLHNNVAEKDLSLLQQSFVEKLEEQRKLLSTVRSKKRKTKVQVPSGKSISAEEINQLREEERKRIEEEKKAKEEEKMRKKEEQERRREEERNKKEVERNRKKEEDLKRKAEEKCRKEEEKKRKTEEKARQKAEERKIKQLGKKKKIQGKKTKKSTIPSIKSRGKGTFH